MISKLITKIKEEQAKLAFSTMTYPEADMLKYGLAVGKYQGLEQALKLIENLLDDQDE